MITLAIPARRRAGRHAPRRTVPAPAVQNASLWATYAQAEVAGLVGVVQCLLIVYGLKMMQWGNADRQRQTDLAEKWHEESMLALRTLIERTAQR